MECKEESAERDHWSGNGSLRGLRTLSKIAEMTQGQSLVSISLDGRPLSTGIDGHHPQMRLLLDIEEDETDRGVINPTLGSRLAPGTNCSAVTVSYAISAVKTKNYKVASRTPLRRRALAKKYG